MDVEWKVALQGSTPQEATTIAAVRKKPAHEKGKRKIVESVEVEKSYKFKENPLVERVALEIDAKRRQRERRVERKKREKKRLEDTNSRL